MKRRNPFPGVTRAPDRHGKVRWRFRRRGLTCYLPGPYGSVEFRAAYEAALDGARPDGRTVAPAEAPGSFEALIRDYLSSPRFMSLAAITRRQVAADMDWLRAAIGDLPVRRFEPRHVEAVMSKKAGPTAANRVKIPLSTLFNYAMRTGQAAGNPARVVEAVRHQSDGFLTWTAADVERYRERWPSGTVQRLALELAINTGAARQDLARLGWPNVADGRIGYRRHKTKTAVDLPILAALEAELRQVSRDRLVFIVAPSGRPYSSAPSFGHAFRVWCHAAGLTAHNSHGVRKFGATEAAESGASDMEIAAIMGHADGRMASVYTRKANRARLADSALAKRTNGQPTVSNLSQRLDKGEGKVVDK